jgi:uncharacterized protein YggE
MKIYFLIHCSMKKLSSSLGIATMALLLSLSVVQPSFAADLAPAAGGYRAISVTGDGKASAMADKAVINLSLDSTDTTARGAKQKNNTIVNKIRSDLASLGITKDDVKIEYSSSYKAYAYPEMMEGDKSVKPTSNSYTSNYSVSVTVKTIKNVDAVLDKVADMESVNMNGVSYMLENNVSAEDQAREKAMKNAENKAKKLAKLYNVEIGKILNLSEYSSSGAYGYSYMGPGQSGDKMEVFVNVSVSYEIK